MKPGTPGEGGFTLVELLVVVVIEAIIMGGLGSAFVLLMNNSTTVKESLARTSDARYAAAYIVSDAANSSGPETSLTDTTSCPDPNPPVSGTATAVVRFDWNATTSTGTTVADIVNYVLVSNTLLRRDCENGTLQSDDPLATNIASATVACAPTTNCTGTPTSITATITETQGSSTASGYQYSLTGAFRKALALGAPLPTGGPSNPYPIFTIGGACNGGSDGIKVSGSASMQVHGDAYINTTNGTCNALDLAGSATFSATGTTKILSGGTSAHSGSTVCPTSTSYSPALTDPYANLTAPSASGLPSESGCSGGTAQPGVYASTLAISGSSTCNLASGVYILQNGLSTANSSQLTSDAAGVLIYVTGGSVALGGNSQVTLSAMTSGSYAGIAIWQAGTDTAAITFGNSVSPAISGAIYGPAAQLTVSGSVQLAVTAVDVQSMAISGSGGLTIGPPLIITSPASLPASTVNQPYPSTTFNPSGGDGSYSWSATGLPAGLTINASTGVLGGTPTTAGTSTPTISLADASGDPVAADQYSVVINAAPSITSASPLTAGEQTLAFTNTLTESGGTAPFTWSASGLPAGLAINAGTGVISGTPTTAGTSTVGVTLTDFSGATTTKNLSLTINPTPTITSVALANGGATPGRIEKSDTITVTYSAQMSVSSFCSTWSNDTHNQTLNTASDVTVSVSTAGVLTVTSATCTFNLGSINLGSTGYASVAATFGGTGSNKSTIAWTASTHTLVITLGAMITGTVTTVGSSTPVYTASSTLTDSQGIALSNSPLTLAAGTQF